MAKNSVNSKRKEINVGNLDLADERCHQISRLSSFDAQRRIHWSNVITHGNPLNSALLQCIVSMNGKEIGFSRKVPLSQPIQKQSISIPSGLQQLSSAGKGTTICLSLEINTFKHTVEPLL